jgi:uncharacterized protein YjbI with pentapeptide repeats
MDSHKCPVEMLRGPCGRQIVRDDMCIFHLVNKTETEASRFENELLDELSKLESSSEQVIDLTRFIFPRTLRLAHHIFPKPVRFYASRFDEDVDFSYTSFTGGVDFGLTYDVREGHNEFRRDASTFYGPLLGERADRGSSFKKKADFSGSIFKGGAGFYEVTFEGDVDFSNATFEGEADFRAAFEGAFCSFENATFMRYADFFCAEFDGLIHFIDTKFEEEADFVSTTFQKSVLFSGAVFKSEANFTESRFVKGGGFYGSIFEAEASFSGSIFESRTYFRRVRFLKPESVVFGRTDLSNVSFLYTERVSAVNFWEVSWSTEENRCKLVDEYEIGELTQTTYASIADVYRRLRLNYEAKLRYAEAGGFFKSEMEMKRMAIAPDLPKHSRLKRVLNWLRRNFSVIALYKLLSVYGESWKLVGIWIVVSIPLFALFRALPVLVSSGTCLPQFGKAILENVSPSFFAFFQSRAVDFFDIIERVWSGLLLGLAYIALRRQLERH